VPLVEFSVSGLRAFDSAGPISVGALTGIVGRNDSGKSGLLHALRLFFEPPKKGLLVTDAHLKDKTREATVELAFLPSELASRSLKVDAKNPIDIVEDRLVAADGLLRARVVLAVGAEPRFELLIADVDDDALFPLALKPHDELLTLLAARDLPAKKAGKETNQEKRAALRAHATAAGVGIRESWQDASAVEKQVRTLLPEWIYFPDTARFGVDETPVQNQFKSIVDKAIANVAEAQAVETAIRGTVQAEFDKVFSFLEKMTPSVDGLTADTKVSWKKAVDDISLTWSDQHGIELPYELRGAGVRRLFMVAYFQYVAADALYSKSDKKYLFAIEEPELHLHPGAQRELISALRDLGDLGHRVVFTTHSPVFASAPEYSSVVLVRRDASAAVALMPPGYNVSDLAHELGIEASDRLVGRNYVILVEGPGDVQFFDYLLREHFAAGLTGLDPEKILFLQCGGVDNLNFVATTECMATAGLKWAVILDSDRPSAGAPCGSVAASLQSTPPASCLAVRVLDRSFIENYFDSADATAETGIPCTIPQFGKGLDAAGAPLGQRAWGRIKKAGPKIAAKMGHAKLVAAAKRADGSCEWTDHFESIRVVFGI
jgi:energy-coupling factor transporter ATP-binding protein EcfA2